MKNLKKNLLLIIAGGALFVSAIFAQDSDLSVDYICKILSASPVTEGNFIQKKYSNKDGRSLVSSGNFVFSKDGIILNTKKPFSSKTGITSTMMIIENAEGKKRVIDNSENANFSSISNVIVSLLNGNKAELEENFLCEISGTKSDWSLKLTPLDSTLASVLTSLELKGANSLTSFVMTSTSGVTTTNLSNLTFREILSDEDKRFLTAQ